MREKQNFRMGEIVAVLDIGTTKVCVLAGRKNEYDKVEVIAEATVTSDGVLRGVIANIDKMVKAIGDAIALCERQLGQSITKVHVGIAGKHIKALKHKGILTRDDTHIEINKTDINKLIRDMYKLVLPPGDQIIHVFPQEYTVDNEQGITDPIGMSGIRLEADFHIVTGQTTATNNITRCVKRCGLSIGEITLEPIASSEAMLSKEEKEAGVALVDIGGGTTDIAIFQEGILRHTAVIPFGGDVVTKDIREGCNVMSQMAEKLKVQHGNALASEAFDNRIIVIPGLKGRDSKEISEKNLARIIQARVEEIFDFIVYEINKSGYSRKLIGGIVLTGGGALLKNIKDLASMCTAYDTRIGYPVEHLAHGYKKKLHSPMYATSVGLLIKALNEQVIEEEIEEPTVEAIEEVETPVETKEQEVEVTPKEGGILQTIFKGAKDFFLEKKDTDFE